MGTAARMTPRYLEWDYDAGKVREYARRGECNGCGQCCMALIRYRVKQFAGRESDNGARLGKGASKSGIWYEIKEGRRRRFMQHIEIAPRPREEACSQLTAQNQCALHARKNWKKDQFTLCDTWPLNPAQVKAFDQCSYEFELIGEWNMPNDDA